ASPTLRRWGKRFFFSTRDGSPSWHHGRLESACLLARSCLNRDREEAFDMADDPGPTEHPKSLADVLAEELDGKIGSDQTQELPLEEKQERLRAVYDRIHAEQPERSALCLSGGGIRSAIFSLGILQGLARHGLLVGFDYLSTV